MSGEANEQTAILKEILKWVKFSGLKEVKEILLSTLNNEEKKLAIYQLSDGDHGIRDIVATLGVGDKTISSLWDLWLKTGLGENTPVYGRLRFKRSFDLRELGIETTEIKEIKGKMEPASSKDAGNREGQQ
jgi:hypothetical protein